MARRNPEQVARPTALTKTDIEYVQSVRNAEAAVVHQEHIVAGCASKLREERAALRDKLTHLRDVAKALPLFDAPARN